MGAMNIAFVSFIVAGVALRMAYPPSLRGRQLLVAADAAC